MKRIIVTGHGWSGSSAFLDFLNCFENDKYFVIKGEFDDFRCPGTMRNALENNILPVSKRTANKRLIFGLFIRSLINDRLLPEKLTGTKITQKRATRLFKDLFNERKIFKKYARLIKNSKNKIQKKNLLKSWINDLMEYYSHENPNAENIFFDHFFLFDDNSELYSWLKFDTLILFIRDPYYQLQSTLESKLLYNNYPWQAQFLIGGGNKFDKRKFELFLETTKLRYSWIKSFLKGLNKNKILIVDYDDFLNNFDNTIKLFSKELDTDLSINKSFFNLAKSKERNIKWDSKIYPFSETLYELKKSYELFKSELHSQYKNIHNSNK